MAVMGSAVDSFAPVFRGDVNVEVRPHWYISFGLSGGVHLLVVVILLIISVLGPVRRAPGLEQTPISLLTIVPVERRTNEITRTRWSAPQRVFANRLAQPRVEAPPAVRVDPPKFPAETIAAAHPLAIRLREQPVLNTFSGADSTLPKLSKRSDRVQIGGLGDANAVATVGSAHRPNNAQTGSSGQNGEGKASGGATGQWGVATGGAFGQAYVSSSPSHQSHRTVEESGFGDKNANTSSGSKPDQTNSRPLFTLAEIIFKPTPAYNPEARSLKIEGEVVAEVLPSASGQARVARASSSASVTDWTSRRRTPSAQFDSGLQQRMFGWSIQ